MIVHQDGSIELDSNDKRVSLAHYIIDPSNPNLYKPDFPADCIYRQCRFTISTCAKCKPQQIIWFCKARDGLVGIKNCKTCTIPH